MHAVPVRTLGAALIGLLLLTTSCKKETETVQPGNGPNGGFAASFVGVRWQLVGFDLSAPVDLDGDGQPDTDLLPFMRPCDLDNTVMFERSGTVAGDNGRLACDDDTDPTTGKPSTWSYDNATKKLRIIDGDDGSVSEWDVIDASASYLKVAVAITEDGQDLKAIMTWKSA